ncbi:MAG TPA: MFS transporter [Pseudomonadales bacterium]|nr:MFS transporter [Pseudomonadales bacterium]
MIRLAPDWPFAPRRLPFFYGWVILVVSTLGILASIPGQTMGMAVFTEPLMEVLGLSRTQLSMAYMLGTIGSSLFLTRAGSLYDRVGARLMLVGASLALALTLCFFAVLDLLIAPLAGGLRAVVAFGLVTVAYLLVRFSGQGVLTSASRNVLLVWFERRRGLVNGLRGVIVSLGFSLAAPVLALLIGILDWRAALLVLALICGVGFALLALLLVRDAPEPCGLLPDGDLPASDAAPSPPAHGVSLDVARRAPVFWIYSLALAMHALFGTGITFHVVSIFAEAGRSAGEAFGYFLPVAVVSTTTNMVASWASDRTAMRPWLLCMLLAFIVAGAGLLLLDRAVGYGLLVLGQGVGGGLWGMVSAITFVRLFGRANLGAISGLNASLMVFFSAVGPALFAVGLDLTSSFAPAVALCVAGFVVLLLAALVIRRLPAEAAP